MDDFRSDAVLGANAASQILQRLAGTIAKVLFLGVHPGKGGGIAVLDEAGLIHGTLPTPIIKSGRGRPEYDVEAIRRFLREPSQS